MLSIGFSLARVGHRRKAAKPKIIMVQVEGFWAALLIVVRRVNDDLRPPLRRTAAGCLRAAGRASSSSCRSLRGEGPQLVLLARGKGKQSRLMN